jgi:hypothetical protein
LLSEDRRRIPYILENAERFWIDELFVFQKRIP